MNSWDVIPIKASCVGSINYAFQTWEIHLIKSFETSFDWSLRQKKRSENGKRMMKKFLSLTSSYMKKSFFSSTSLPEKNTESKRKNKRRFWNCSCSKLLFGPSHIITQKKNFVMSSYLTYNEAILFIVIVWLVVVAAKKACMWMWMRAIVNNKNRFEHSLSELNHRLHDRAIHKRLTLFIPITIWSGCPTLL